MPAEQHGQPYKIGPGRWGIRFYATAGVRRRRSGFTSRSAALAHYRDILRPQIMGAPVAPVDRTFSEHVEEWLAVKAGEVEAITVDTLRNRLKVVERRFGTVRLSDLERMAPEIGRFAAGLGDFRYAVMAALRQCLDAAVRWRLLSENPAKLVGRNPQPPVVEVTPFTVSEVDKIAAELRTGDEEEKDPRRRHGATYAAAVVFAADSGLRPSEWVALERRDVDRAAGVVIVERTFSSGVAKPYGKTTRSRRRVPLTDRAVAALDGLPSRIDTRLLFPSAHGGHLDLHNWRCREWYPAVEAAGLAKRGPYALRHSYATWALRAGLGTFELARYMGTSVEMIDRTYGHLAAGSEERARTLLGAYAAEEIAQAEAEAKAQEGNQ
jgi:integrase